MLYGYHVPKKMVLHIQQSYYVVICLSYILQIAEISQISLTTMTNIVQQLEAWTPNNMILTLH